MLVCVASMDHSIARYRVEEIAREKERKRKESEEAKRKKKLRVDKSLALSDKIVNLLSPLEEQWMARRLVREGQVRSTLSPSSDRLDDAAGAAEMSSREEQALWVSDSSAMKPLASVEMIALVSRRNADRSGLLLWACEEGLAELARTHTHTYACIRIYVHTHIHIQTHVCTHIHVRTLLTF